MKTLSADDILKAKDVTTAAVDVPEWGGRVFVREFSAATREQFDRLISGDGESDEIDTTNIRARVVALAACDEAGAPLFTAEQAEALAGKTNSAIDRLYEKAAALNKLRRQDHEGEKKESAAPPPAPSPTA